MLWEKTWRQNFLKGMVFAEKYYGHMLLKTLGLDELGTRYNIVRYIPND